MTVKESIHWEDVKIFKKVPNNSFSLHETEIELKG